MIESKRERRSVNRFDILVCLSFAKSSDQTRDHIDQMADLIGLGYLLPNTNGGDEIVSLTLSETAPKQLMLPRTHE